MTTKPDFAVLVDVLQSSTRETAIMLLKLTYEQAYYNGLNNGWANEQDQNPQGEL